MKKATTSPCRQTSPRNRRNSRVN